MRAEGVCRYCGTPLTGQQTVKCGADECRREYHREYMRACYQGNQAYRERVKRRGLERRADPVLAESKRECDRRAYQRLMADPQKRELERKRNRDRMRAKNKARKPPGCVVCGEELPLGRRVLCGKEECRRARRSTQQSKRWAVNPEYREQARQRLRERYETDPEYRARRREMWARVIPWPVRLQVFNRDNWTCHLCRYPVPQDAVHPDPMSASVDHVVPRSKGGSDDADNLRCAHLACNVRRQAKDARAIAKRLTRLQDERLIDAVLSGAA